MKLRRHKPWRDLNVAEDIAREARADDWAFKIRDLIRPLHDEVEATPIARAILEQRITREQYIRLLVEKRPLHLVLDEAIFETPQLAPLCREDMRRLPGLDRDLRALGGERRSPSRAALAAAAEIARDRGDPCALLGALYVVEGSRLGSCFLVHGLAAALSLPVEPGGGLDYHREGMEEAFPRFAAFKRALNDAYAGFEERAAIMAGACRAMALMGRVYRGAQASAMQESA